MNGTIGERGLVSSLMAFRITPSFRIISAELSTQAERMRIQASAHMEMNSIVVERREQAALTREIPPRLIVSNS